MNASTPEQCEFMHGDYQCVFSKGHEGHHGVPQPVRSEKPAGDDTESLRADRLVWALDQNKLLMDMVEDAEARVAGLEAREASLRNALTAIQAVAVMAQNEHAKDHRVDWLREIEDRARVALADSGEAGS